MKKLFIAAFLVLFSLYSNAQNWSLASYGKNYFFNLKAGQQPQATTYQKTGFKLDSLEINNSDSIYHTSKHLVPSPNTSFYACDTLVETFFGLSYQQTANGTILTTLGGDSLYFPDFSTIQTNWRLLTLSNGAYFEGTILTRDTLSFKGVIDSVQYYKISFYDSSGNIDHSVLGDTLSILKQSGQLTTYDWSNFGDSVTFQYKQLPKTLLTKREVYNFNVGDEIHYTIYQLSNPTDYKNIKILSKSLFPDSVTYMVDVKSEYNYLDYSIWPPLRTSFYSYQDTITYSNLDVKVGDLPYQLSSKYGGIDYYINSFNMTNRKGYTYRLEGIFYDSLINLYCGNFSYKERTYIEGLGSIDYNYNWNGGGNSTYDRETIVYYKKGNYTWGTPHIITGIEKQQAKSSKPWFYPNPAKDKLHLMDNLKFSEVQILDIKGQLVQQFENPISEIDVSSFKAGVYVFKAILIDGTINQEKLIIQH